jgi:hypothetical protein
VVVVVAVDRSGRVVVSAGRVEAARLGRRKSSIGDWQSARGKMGMESHETPVFADGGATVSHATPFRRTQATVLPS